MVGIVPELGVVGVVEGVVEEVGVEPLAVLGVVMG